MFIRNSPFFFVGLGEGGEFWGTHEVCSSVLNTSNSLEIPRYATGLRSSKYDSFNDVTNSSDFTVPTLDMIEILRRNLVETLLLFCSP